MLSCVYMDPVVLIILFIFGIAIGSFLNVVTLRYDGDHFVLDAKMIAGENPGEMRYSIAGDLVAEAQTVRLALARAGHQEGQPHPDQGDDDPGADAGLGGTGFEVRRSFGACPPGDPPSRRAPLSPVRCRARSTAQCRS